MLTVVIPVNSEFIRETHQSSSEATQGLVCNDLNIVEVRKQKTQFFEEEILVVSDGGSSEHAMQVAKVMVCVVAVPMHAVVHHQSACDEVFSEGLMVYAIFL